MKNKNLGLRVAGTIFGIGAALHLLRALVGWEFIIVGWHVQHWVSLVVAMAAGALSVWLWSLSRE